MIKKRLNFVTRFLPGLFTGLLLFSGCSQDDVSGVPAGSRVIGFRAQGGMSSLKATTTGADYIQSFVVSAHYSDDWTSATGKYLLRGATVYRGESGTGWDYSPKAYFPVTNEGAVEFFAYSPSGSKNVESGLASAATEEQEISYKVPSPTGPATTQEDLLVACTGVLQVNNAYPGTVSLQFRHALSRILVKAVSTLDKEVSVTVTGLTLRNLHSKGTLNLKDVPDAGAPGWAYSQTVTDAADPDVVYVKWDDPSVLSNYSYSLPESGVSVSDAPKYVTGADQGIFILPQTTVAPGSNSPKENVVDDEEFGLAIAYSINGIAALDSAYVQFGDLNGISTAGVTFENGRQYVLNLTFGAGGGEEGSTDPSINIGAVITFSPLVDEKLDGPVVVPPPDPDHDPAATNVWAASNIYFKPEVQAAGNGDGTGDGDVGTLTFAESKASGTIGGKEGYQGVYFKWGSLVGVSTNTSGTGYDDDNTYLFIPDLTTGKYHKYKVGNVAGSSDATVAAYLGKATNKDWGSIPCADDSGLTTGREVDALSEIHNQEANYKGDICKYLSEKRSVNGSGLVSEWRMPVSDMFAGSGYLTPPYTVPGNGSSWSSNPNWSGFDGSDTNGASQTANAFMTYMYFPTGETVFFPASGGRSYDDGYLDYGNGGGYWSSSADGASFAYYMFFGSSLVGPDGSSTRSFGFSVRCVRPGENVAP